MTTAVPVLLVSVIPVRRCVLPPSGVVQVEGLSFITHSTFALNSTLPFSGSRCFSSTRSFGTTPDAVS